MGMPVSPRMTAPLIQPPLDVVSNMLPSLSITDMCVVSFGMPALARRTGVGGSWFAVRRLLYDWCEFGTPPKPRGGGVTGACGTTPKRNHTGSMP